MTSLLVIIGLLATPASFLPMVFLCCGIVAGLPDWLCGRAV